jgi:hypothetical protein
MTDDSDQPYVGASTGDDGRHVLVEFKAFRQQRETPLVTFHRRELDAILRLYGRMVAEGEWRDYAIDHLKDRAIFSVFRRTSEVPLYRIEKNPRLARKQGAFSVIAATGMILKRGHEIDHVLRVFDKSPKLVRN